MPAYEYICTSCGVHDIRISGIDDHTAICDQCGQVMMRNVDVDSLLASYSGGEEKFESQVG